MELILNIIIPLLIPPLDLDLDPDLFLFTTLELLLATKIPMHVPSCDSNINTYKPSFGVISKPIYTYYNYSPHYANLIPPACVFVRIIGFFIMYTCNKDIYAFTLFAFNLHRSVFLTHRLCRLIYFLLHHNINFPTTHVFL